jgi:hypothetical protein
MDEGVPIIRKSMAKHRSVGDSFKEITIHPSGTFIDHKKSGQNVYMKYLIDAPLTMVSLNSVSSSAFSG